MRRSGNIALLALSLSSVAACVSDLSVGLSALQDDDSGVTEPDSEMASDGGRADAARGDASTRDAQRPHDGGGRDASELDARLQGDGCALGRCASTDDAAARDANLRDAESSDAARPCALSDCQMVGLRTLAACTDGMPRQCLRDESGRCDLLCPPSDFVGTTPAADGRDR